MTVSDTTTDSSAARSAPADAPAVGMPARSRKRFELLEECRELILQRLTEVVAQALNRMSDELTAEALRQVKPEQQQALLDAVMLVRENRMEIESRFRRSFGDIFERRLFTMNAAADAGAAPAEAAELTLVSDDMIEDKLNVDRLIGRARSRLDPDEVLGIRARLGALLERDWFEENRHPAAPEAVFEALKSALAELSPRAEVKSALLDAFEPHVSQNLNGIYAIVNQRLRAQHVLPKIRPQVQGAQGGARKPGAKDARDEARDERDPKAGSWVAGPMGVHEPPPDGNAAAAAVDGYVPLDDPVSALNRAMADATAGRANGKLQVARMLSNPAMFGVADIPVSPVQRPLVASLTALQRDATAGDAAGMLPALVERVREQGSPLDQITVEIVSMVFDYIYADRRLPDPVKQQLLRLQVVAVKAALLDRSFFARRQHPMRRLIDRISDVGADPDADVSSGAPLIAGLGTVVDRIVAEFDADLALFDEALEEIERLAREEAERRAAQLEAIARDAAQREAIALAQDAAREELGRRLDKDSPAFVREFLHRWWTQVLARLRTGREGEAAEQAWTVGLRTADYLIWSVSPKQTDEIPRLAAVLPGLIRGVNQGLERVEMPEAERAAFFDELLRAHTLVISAAKKRAGPSPAVASVAAAASVRMQPDGQVRYVPKAGDPSADSPPTLTASDELLASLRRGLRIEMVDDDEARVFKLAWISPARKLFILSRHPEQSLTVQGSEFAFMLQRGRARVVPDDTTLDRAIGSVTGEASVPHAADAPADERQPLAA